MSANNVNVFEGFSNEILDEILSNIRKIKVTLIGDVCLDVYWLADMAKSELSRETPHFPLPVVQERVSPGAGGNVAMNIAALKPEKVSVISVIGRDWRGRILLEELNKAKIDVNSVIISKARITDAYCKPVRRGLSELEYEDPRIDFCNYEQLGQEDEGRLLELLEDCSNKTDVLCICDQFRFGCITAAVRNKAMKLAEQGLKVIVDSRNRIGLYRGVVLKPNEVEGYKAVYPDGDPRTAALDEQIAAAVKLSELNKASVCMTLGAKGCIYSDGDILTMIPSFKAEAPIDICGAGDSFLSGFSCAMASGAKPTEAAFFANLASNITIKKIGMTGTASQEEVRKRYQEIGI